MQYFHVKYKTINYPYIEKYYNEHEDVIYAESTHDVGDKLHARSVRKKIISIEFPIEVTYDDAVNILANIAKNKRADKLNEERTVLYKLFLLIKRLLTLKTKT